MSSKAKPQPFNVVTAPFEPGLSLVEASAGTGKTFSLALSMVRLLLEGSATEPVVSGIGRILVVTFTNAATDELINRIRRVLRTAVDVYSGMPMDEHDGTVKFLREMAANKPWAEARMRAALAAVDTLSVFTIHGFAKRVLDEFALESGTPFGAALLENEDDLVREALHDWWRRTFYETPHLAQLAVAADLRPDSFLGDYRTWMNWPGATLAPDLTFSAFEAQLLEAVRAFAEAWKPEAFAERALALTWNKGAPCADAAQIEALDAAVQRARRLRVGDPALWREIVPLIEPLTAEALTAKATKRSAVQKAQAATIPDWPECAAAKHVVEVALRQVAALRADCLRTVREVVAAEKARRQVIGFGDLLERLHGVLDAQGPTGLLATTVRAQFDAAMIDEFQDTDARQFRIFTTIFADRPLFLIGDPKQAIYGFRGADVRAYLTAASLTPETRRYSLQRNFRSTRDMVESVNALFLKRKNPFMQHGIGYPPAVAEKDYPLPAALPGGHALELTWLEPGDDGRAYTGGEAERVSLVTCVNDIVGLLHDGWKPRHIAVLVRTGYEGRAVEALLREANVPAVVSGMDDVFHSHEMDELHRLLQAIATPRHAPLVRAALATDLWGARHEDIARLLAPEAEAEWEQTLNAFTRWRDRWARDGLMAMLQACFTEQRVFKRLLPLTDGDRRVTNLRHAMELLHTASVERQLHIDGVLRWLAAERLADHTEADATELRLETDADAVQIVTIHKSKGLEYDIVFCPTLWNARLTSKAPVVVQEADGTVFEHGSASLAARVAVANAARLAEDLRLLYVALTRARFRTYATWGPVVKGNAKERDACLKADGSIHSALGYLLLVDELVDTLPPADVPAHAAAALLDGMTSMPAHLKALAKGSRGRIVVRAVQGAVGGARWEPPQPAIPTLAARTLPTDLAPARRFRTFALTSYTALASGRSSDTVADLAEDVARDLDAPLPSAATIAVTSAALRALPRGDFRAFPAGAREGTVLHRLFETSGFTDTSAQLRPRAARLLQWHHLAESDADERIDAVVEMMTAVYRAPFTAGAQTVRLADVLPTRARHEWQFTLPVANAQAPLSARAIADAFRRAQDPALQRYADAVAALPMRLVFGFLQGFVDLVFEHDGRWWIVDWKSNRLPLAPQSYAPEALFEVMAAHHYLLQAHLYLVAVHRYLRTRLPNYHAAQHLGGVAYAFLRGFGPDASATGHGWFTMPADLAVIEALDAALGNGDALAVTP
ncbi:MAG: UvrD-helicase domain-containing protein [Gemmatimonadaceae bacterium]|nr:UvrD-helicase domain-containing protein [Gemmatimonadaceae bacterium]